MNYLRRLKYLLPAYRREQEREMEAELNALEEMAAEDVVRLGNLTLAREDARAAWGWTWLASLYADIRYAWRTLRKDRVFTAVAILSLALGIGANAAIFSIIDKLLLESLPVRDPSSLVLLDDSDSSYFTYLRFAANTESVFSGIFARCSDARDVDTGGGPTRANIELVTGSYFPTLGVRPWLGRTLDPDDDRRGNPAPVAVISYGLWRRRYAGDPSAIGRTIRVQRSPFTIIGIAPPEFFGVVVGQAPEVWLPLSAHASVFPGRHWLDEPNTNFLELMGRLRPGVTPQRAADVLTPVLIRTEFDRNPHAPESVRAEIRRERVNLIPAATGISWLRYRFSGPLRIVFGMVAITLLLACLNLINLQAARVREHRKEFAVRLAIGASRLRVAREVFTESALLALAGGACGLLLCGPLAHALLDLMSPGDPIALGLGLNHQLFAFVAAISMAAAILFGTGPAWRSTRGEILPALQSGSGAAKASPANRMLGRGLAALQIALSLVLVAGAILFATSLYKLLHADFGLNPSHVLVLDVDAVEAGYQASQSAALSRRLVTRLAPLAGVESVSFSAIGIFTGRNMNRAVEPVGQPKPANPYAWYDEIGPRYFTTIGAQMVAGRDFDERDNLAAPKVMIVNQQLARFYFPGLNPIGRSVAVEEVDRKPKVLREIVGVVKDLRNEGSRQQPAPYFYLPAMQTVDMPFSTRFLIRAACDPRALYASIRAAVRAEDPALNIVSLDAAGELLDRAIGHDRLMAALAAAFGVLALLLAAIGIYGLVSYEVARRTGEMGIRTALGANRADIMRLILSEIAGVAIVGVTLGGTVALAASRLITGLVFGLQPNDPLVLVGAALVLMAVALSAAYWPARRAALLDPLAALRRE